jgi:hypothetical protein
MKKKFLKAFIFWLPFAAVITFACGLSYLLVQQDIRTNANDPQTQIAEDISGALASGATPQDIVPPGEAMDISTSLDPYVIIFSASGTVLGSSATLNGQTPLMPSDVFASVRQHGEDKFTWQPAPGVRSAVVVDAVPAPGSGFVLAGRSIRVIETREDNILRLAELSWLAGIVVMFIIIWAMVVLYEKHEHWKI